MKSKRLIVANPPVGLIPNIASISNEELRGGHNHFCICKSLKSSAIEGKAAQCYFVHASSLVIVAFLNYPD